MTARRNMWLIAAAVGLLAALAIAAYWFTHRTPAAKYVTAPATVGDVQTKISASGSVNPVVTVQVGTYVSGTITALGCDYNTEVRKGQLCAKIDPQPYTVLVQEAEANVASARAQLVKDQADAAYAKLAHGRQDLLWSEQSTSRDARDAALNAYDQAVAALALDRANIQQREAALHAANVNLNYTNIVSPVDGTVVSRNVNVGQTVAASFSTPTLFLIANDLTKMQVDTNVSESDIAGVKPGAAASFTVDAYPRKVFQGQVAQVRLAPVSVQNVITYDVVVTVANPDLLLRPGMTATARIVKAEAHNVLRVPSQALRFTPASAAKSAPAAGRHVLWVRRDGQLVAVAVKVGLDDDSFAEIKSGDLKAGDQVVTAEGASGGSANGGNRPANGAGGARATTPSMRF